MMADTKRKRVTKRVTKRDIEKLVIKHGGTIVNAGPDDWDIMSPIGYCWKEAGVRCYPLPLGECDTAADRQELLQQAMEFLAEIEPIENDDRIPN